jgi:hypothetical protein
VTRYASGTSSIRRKSKQDELRKLADGSLELKGGMTVSKDMIGESDRFVLFGAPCDTGIREES